MAKRNRTCMGPECDRRAGWLGYCTSHYAQQRQGRKLTPLRAYVKIPGDRVCSVPDCDRPHKARGLCAQHWKHVRLYGEVRPIKPYDLQGRVCGIKDCGQPAVAKLRCRQHLQYGYNLSRFGIDVGDFVRMQDEQGGVCAICGDTNTNGKALSVDHDHECCPGDRSCGACIRGLLCAHCNFAVGMMRDDPDRLRAAAAYIERKRAVLV
jgi:hypothetical protein